MCLCAALCNNRKLNVKIKAATVDTEILPKSGMREEGHSVIQPKHIMLCFYIDKGEQKKLTKVFLQ